MATNSLLQAGKEASQGWGQIVQMVIGTSGFFSVHIINSFLSIKCPYIKLQPINY